MAELFAGRHFYLGDHHPVRALVPALQAQFPRSGRDGGGTRTASCAYYDHARWVQRYVPEFENRWNRYARKAGRSWRVDETYLKVRGNWVYLYRAVDRDGNTVDFRLSRNRDAAAAKAFFRKAIRTQGRAPVSITLDGYAASHRTAREMPNENQAWKQTRLRSSKYLNNLIEQDHRGIKSRTRPVLGFKSYDNAAITIAGVELLHRIRKEQFSLSRLQLKDQGATAIWNAVLAAQERALF